MSAADLDQNLPYTIAVLCYLYDDAGRVLLLHRAQDPNKGMYSPIGGKLKIDSGEGPHECALREIKEETGLSIHREALRLTGIVSECAYQHEAHWLIFLFEVTTPVDPDTLRWADFDEGTLEWKLIDEVAQLEIPRTDREVMWPLVQSHRAGFFVVHIEWSADDKITWTVHESIQEGTEVRRHEGACLAVSPVGLTHRPTRDRHDP